jgi:nucleotide-binding universal stress UspA family protein
MSVDIQTILVATDFSTASEAAMTYAFQLARSLGARIYLLHVVPESDVEVVPLHGHPHPDLAERLYASLVERIAAS